MFTFFQKLREKKINEWCNQVPVLGFNSGSYDLNVIKTHFVEQIAETSKRIKVAKNGNKTMFIHPRDFRFLDIINYLGPGQGFCFFVAAGHIDNGECVFENFAPAG